MVLRKGLVLLGAGVITGILLALGSTWLLRSFLFGIGPTDLVTYTGVILLLAIITLVATYFPARRATLVDPVRALRTE